MNGKMDISSTILRKAQFRNRSDVVRQEMVQGWI
jgi:hypothetical protein